MLSQKTLDRETTAFCCCFSVLLVLFSLLTRSVPELGLGFVGNSLGGWDLDFGRQIFPQRVLGLLTLIGKLSPSPH